MSGSTTASHAVRARSVALDLCTLGCVVIVTLVTPVIDDVTARHTHIAISMVLALAIGSAVLRFPAARAVWGPYAIGALFYLHHTAVIGPAAAIPAALAMTAFGWGTVGLIRPLLADAGTRRETAAALPALVTGGLGVLFVDPGMYPGGPGVIGLGFVLLTAVCGVVLLGWVVRCRHALARAGRRAEHRLMAATVVLVLGSALSSVDYTTFFATPPLSALAIVAAAALGPGAGLVGTAFGPHARFAPIPFGRGIAAAGAAGVVLPLIHAGVSPTVAILLVPVSIVIAWWFVQGLRRPTPGRRTRTASLAESTARALRVAILAEAADIHFQPIVRVSDGATVGFEALVRWRDAPLTSVPTGTTIELAVRAGLAPALDLLVVGLACRQLDELSGSAYVAVNVLPASLQQPGFASSVLDRLPLRRGFARPLDGIVLEIVEAGAVTDWPTLTSNVEALRAAGARIALDDFGTGTSNFRSFGAVPVDIVKIDRSIVDWAGTSRGRSVLAHLVAMAHECGATVVAEGVENEQMLALVVGVGVDCVQGYLFGRPGPTMVAHAASPLG
jgi:EAL domain-containing protein (putative c-di-GMP-specific phosphodiesterase class I)